MMSRFAIVALVLLACESGRASEATLKVAPGQIAPRFVLPRLENDSRRVSLRDFADSAKFLRDPKGLRGVVLAFWSTTCVSCRAEMPRLDAWAKTRPDVAFLPVLVEGVTPQDGQSWLDGIGVASRGLHDRYQVVGKSYGVCEGNLCTVPVLVVIAPDQKVKIAKSGYNPSDPLEAILNKALPSPAQ